MAISQPRDSIIIDYELSSHLQNLVVINYLDVIGDSPHYQLREIFPISSYHHQVRLLGCYVVKYFLERIMLIN